MGVTLWYDVRDQDGQVLATFQPDSPNITYRLSDVGDHTIRIPLSDPELTYALFAPRRTDFRLKVSTDGGSTFQGIQGGICAPVSLKSREDFVTVRGFDWLAWLDQPYHFEGYSKAPATWVDTDIIKYWVNESQQTIIDDLCDGMYDGTSETININPVFSGAGWLSNIEVHYIQLGDTTTVLDLIRAVGSLAEPYGFDFTCADVTKQMFC